jgi:pimeloyl-ACP methyl ester carboxylesterase
MGGGIAGELAARYPGQLRSVTFISPAGIHDCSFPSAMDSLMSRYTGVEEKKKHFPLLPETYSRANVALFKRYIFHGSFFAPNRLFRVYMSDILENRDFYIDVLGDFVDIESGDFIDPLDDELEAIRCPVNIIWGRQDPLLHYSCHEKMLEYLPVKPYLTLIEDCGHATIAEKPKLTARAMKRFYREVIQ